jgi:phosphomannomutase
VSDPAAIFKAYDIRGVVPDQLDDEVSRAIGWAFVAVAEVLPECGAVVVGRDMRASSAGLASAFADGVMAAGADVIDIGLASTDELYFASGRLDLPGAMFTASHNPSQYNGIKLCLAGASPLGRDTGLGRLQEQVTSEPFPAAGQGGVERGARQSRDMLGAYAEQLRELVPVRGRALTVVVDAGNGMAGHTAPAVFAGLDVELVPMYFELDGTFPHHPANPIEPENLKDLQAKVTETGADLGLAFDGDADRCFVVDEHARAVSPSTITALIASRELAREPGATVLHNLITSQAVPQVVLEHRGVPVRTRVGHTFIKATMARTGAIFGGEHSGHYYFRDFWCADSGMLAALHVLAALAETDSALSTLLRGFERFSASGEINTTSDDPEAVLAEVEGAYSGRDGITVDHLDGITVTSDHWWFNVRTSNTEPLLRVNAEGDDEATMVRIRDEVLELTRSYR